MSWLFPEPLQRQEIASTWPERKYSEKLENIRVIWRIFVQWFIFFWTINITILQLQFRNVSPDRKMGAVEVLVPAMFLVLNLLGVGVCLVVRRSLRSTNLSARAISMTIDGETEYPFDSVVISYSTNACTASLVMNCLLWAFISAFEVYGPERSWNLVRPWLPG